MNKAQEVKQHFDSIQFGATLDKKLVYLPTNLLINQIAFDKAANVIYNLCEE